MYRTACRTPLCLKTLQLNLSVSDRETPLTVNLGPILLIEKYVQYNLWQDHFIRKKKCDITFWLLKLMTGAKTPG